MCIFQRFYFKKRVGEFRMKKKMIDKDTYVFYDPVVAKPGVGMATIHCIIARSEMYILD